MVKKFGKSSESVMSQPAKRFYEFGPYGSI
jgi:hypothetical protein